MSSEECIQGFLDNVSLSTLTKNQTLKCVGLITESELLKALASMENDKSPENESITKVISSLITSKLLKNLSLPLFNSFL